MAGTYLVVMLGVVRPLGAWFVRRQSSIGLSYELLGIIIAVVLASAAATEAIGVHPLFGAFMAGLCFPRIEHWQAAVRTRLDMLVSVLLLPLFFALTGMRTRLDLLNGSRIWLWTGVVLLVAVAGKMGGAVLAARWTGQSWKKRRGAGRVIEYARPGRTDRFEYCLQRPCLFADAVHHAGRDGAGDDDDHDATAEPDWLRGWRAKKVKTWQSSKPPRYGAYGETRCGTARTAKHAARLMLPVVAMEC